MNHNEARGGWFSPKTLMLVVLGAASVAAMLYRSGLSTETTKKAVAAPTASQSHKPVRAMNLALGPMVFLAKEFDFSIKNAKGENVQDPRLAGRIESELQSLRERYRQEIAKNDKLVGSMILQFSVSAAGAVSQVSEISARIKDAEFKKLVLAEAGKWSFAELAKEPLTVHCPLLFVQEGMDITTLVRWESSLTGSTDKVAATPAAKPAAGQLAKTSATAAAPTVAAKAAVPEAKAAAAQEFQVKYATLLRKQPNFNAPVITTYTIGTKVLLIARSGEWLEVRPHHNGPSGFIRQEFVKPVNLASQY